MGKQKVKQENIAPYKIYSLAEFRRMALMGIWPGANVEGLGFVEKARPVPSYIAVTLANDPTWMKYQKKVASKHEPPDKFGLYLSVGGYVISKGEALMFNKATWFSIINMRSYGHAFHGNQYTFLRSDAKSIGMRFKWLGRSIGIWNYFQIKKQGEEGLLSKRGVLIEQTSNAFATFGGTPGAGWGIGWEIGRQISGNDWYRENVRPHLQDFLGVERDEFPINK
ncbi:hypothetical protein [Pedobacter cryoconitis]|uniref:Uncharacterized protein n=1 Tax=Pedobacter cryoconitis TaxID=188932 RepID=A0A327SRT9_9SPHI|nr:hypothetical protein [Pedobacter cryoconitis]RAJ31145.1 hypothetical protein LY11_02376 [Pedobacter cryoconitis]